MRDGRKGLSVGLIGLLCVLYFFWPIDLMPGCPVDDILVMIIGIASMNRK